MVGEPEWALFAPVVARLRDTLDQGPPAARAEVDQTTASVSAALAEYGIDPTGESEWALFGVAVGMAVIHGQLAAAVEAGFLGVDAAEVVAGVCRANIGMLVAVARGESL